MKPIRRLMGVIEIMDENITTNWHKAADPSSIPLPGPVTNRDFEDALENTKAASSIPVGAYEKWFSEYGSV